MTTDDSRPWIVIALMASGISALPLFTIIFLSFVPGVDGTLTHLYHTVLPGYVLTTAKLTFGVGCGVLILGTSTAWLVTAYEFPGRALFNQLLLMPMAMPAYIIAIVYIELLDFAGPVQSFVRQIFGWQSMTEYWFPPITSLGGAIFLLSLVLYPYVFLMARTAFGEQGRRLLEVGQTLNLSPWMAFFRLVLPLSRPAIVSGLLLAIMETVGDFGLVQLFSVNTFTVGIYNIWLGASNLPDAARLATGVLSLMVLLIFLEYLTRRRKRYAQNTGAPMPLKRLSKKTGILASLWCLFPLVFGFFLPFFLQIFWFIKGFSDIQTHTFVSDAKNSLLLGTTTAFFGLCIAILLAYGKRLAPSKAIHGIIRFATIGYALPGPVVALGVLIPLAWLDRQFIAMGQDYFGWDPGYLLSGSICILVLGLLVRFMAMSFGSVDKGLERIPYHCDEAARMLKTTPLGILGRIHLPLLRGSMLTAVLLVLVEVMKELPATLMLQPFNFSTLATRAFSYASEEMYKQASLWSVTIVLVGILPIFSINHRLLSNMKKQGTSPDS